MVGASVAAQRRLEQITAELRKGYDIFEACCNERDSERMVREFFTPGVLFGATGIPLARGAGEIFPVVSGLVDAVNKVQIRIVEIRVDDTGELAYAIVDVDIELPDGGNRVDRALCVWRRGPSGWRVDTDWAVLG